MAISRLFDFVYKTFDENPKRGDALVTKYNNEWRKTSILEFITMGNKVSRGLLKLGINPGDKIALITSNNRTEWAAMDLGISQIGAISIPVYPSISIEDYIYIFNNAEIKYCFVSDEALYKKIKKVQPQVSSLVGIFTFDKVEGAPNWNEVVDLGEDEATQIDVETLKRGIQPGDIATIIYTSGTTGRPKGVMLSHENIVANVLTASPIIMSKSPKGEPIRSLSFLPICHIFERMLFYFYINNGISIYFAESIDKIADNIREVSPHYMTVVPRIMEKIYDKIYDKGINAGGIKSKIFLWALGVNKSKKEIGHPKNLKEIIADRLVFKKWREAFGGNIITLICGSAALSPRLNKMFQNAGITILEGYGLTETSPVISVNTFNKMKLGTVGLVLPNLKVKIQGDGEISVKGPSVMVGYYNDKEKTKDSFTEDGYFKTGDIGHIDEEGFLHITDRKKEMFKTSGGKYIAPQVIENMAKASKFIEQIMVVGEGEKMPCALVQPDFNFAINWAKRHHLNIGTTPQEIANSPEFKARIEKEIEYLNTKLGNWEKIKKIEITPEIWSVEAGLLTPTLKLKRKVIKEKFIDLYNKMYGHHEK